MPEIIQCQQCKKVWNPESQTWHKLPSYLITGAKERDIELTGDLCDECRSADALQEMATQTMWQQKEEMEFEQN